MRLSRVEFVFLLSWLRNSKDGLEGLGARQLLEVIIR